MTDDSAIHKQTGASLSTVRSALSVAKKTGKVKKSVNLNHTGGSNSPPAPSNSTLSEDNGNNTPIDGNNSNSLATIDDLSEADKSRLIQQYLLKQQATARNNGHNVGINNISEIQNPDNSQTGGIIPEQTNNQEQFSHIVWLQSEPIIRCCV